MTDTKDKKDENGIHEMILEFLADAPRGLSTTQITQLLNAQGIRISRVSVRKYLLELFGKGLVQRDKIGVAMVWYLVPEEEQGRPVISPAEWEIMDKIFNYLDTQDHLRSIQEIADALDINRNTIANILRIMEQLELVEEHGQGRNSLWRIKTRPQDLRHVHSRIAVVLVECDCGPKEEETDDDEEKSGSSPANRITMTVLSMNSIARHLANMAAENIPQSLKLHDLEIQMFQRPLMSTFLENRLKSAIDRDSSGTMRLARNKVPRSITIQQVFPRLEEPHNTVWKVSAQIEEPVNGSQDETPRFLITYQDITAKFHLKHLIWRSARSFQEFFKDLSVPVALITPDFKIIEGNTEFQQLIGNTDRFWGYHCFSLFRGKSRPCEDCPILTQELPRELVVHGMPQRADGVEFIYFPGEPHPRKYKMRVIVNVNQQSSQVTSYFLILQPMVE